MNKHFLLKDLMLCFMCACEGWSCEDGLEVKRRIRVEREPEPFQQASAQSCRAFIFPGTYGEAKNLLESGRYIHRCVQFDHFRQHGLCSCLITEAIVRNPFSGKGKYYLCLTGTEN